MSRPNDTTPIASPGWFAHPVLSLLIAAALLASALARPHQIQAACPVHARDDRAAGGVEREGGGSAGGGGGV